MEKMILIWLIVIVNDVKAQFTSDHSYDDKGFLDVFAEIIDDYDMIEDMPTSDSHNPVTFLTMFTQATESVAAVPTQVPELTETVPTIQETSSTESTLQEYNYTSVVEKMSPIEINTDVDFASLDYIDIDKLMTIGNAMTTVVTTTDITNTTTIRDKTTAADVTAKPDVSTITDSPIFTNATEVQLPEITDDLVPSEYPNTTDLATSKDLLEITIAKNITDAVKMDRINTNSSAITIPLSSPLTTTDSNAFNKNKSKNTGEKDSATTAKMTNTDLLTTNFVRIVRHIPSRTYKTVTTDATTNQASPINAKAKLAKFEDFGRVGRPLHRSTVRYTGTFYRDRTKTLKFTTTTKKSWFWKRTTTTTTTPKPIKRPITRTTRTWRTQPRKTRMFITITTTTFKYNYGKTTTRHYTTRKITAIKPTETTTTKPTPIKTTSTTSLGEFEYIYFGSGDVAVIELIKVTTTKTQKLTATTTTTTSKSTTRQEASFEYTNKWLPVSKSTTRQEVSLVYTNKFTPPWLQKWSEVVRTTPKLTTRRTSKTTVTQTYRSFTDRFKWLNDAHDYVYVESGNKKTTRKITTTRRAQHGNMWWFHHHPRPTPMTTSEKTTKITIEINNNANKTMITTITNNYTTTEIVILFGGLVVVSVFVFNE